MKTAITELIEKLISFRDNPSDNMEIDINYFKQKEREQIVDAFNVGQANWDPKCRTYENGNHYYNCLH